MEKKFGKLAQNVWSYKTPGMPKFSMVRAMVESKKIFIEDQDYQSGIGMLLYLVRHLCPDLANMTRKLSKANNGANPMAYKENLSVIRYVLDMKNLGLKIKSMGNSNKPWGIICISYSDYAGDPVSR